MVAQSDWLPMMIATGFPAIRPPNRPHVRKKEAADYRVAPGGGKAAALFRVMFTRERIRQTTAIFESECSFSFTAPQQRVDSMRRANTQLQSDRRAEILAAAQRCFVRSGFHGASMQDICAEAG